MTLHLELNPTPVMLATAGPALVRVRRQEPEFPPSELDTEWRAMVDPAIRREARHAAFSAWLAAEEDTNYYWRAGVIRWAQIAAHVAVAPPRAAIQQALHDCGFIWTGKAEICKLWVDPQLQQKGLGTQLLEAALTECQSRRLRPVLWAAVDNHIAGNLYEKHGFTDLGVVEYPEGPYRLMLGNR